MNDTRRLVVGLGSQRICSVQDRQVNDTRRSVVGALGAHRQVADGGRRGSDREPI